MPPPLRDVAAAVEARAAVGGAQIEATAAEIVLSWGRRRRTAGRVCGRRRASQGVGRPVSAETSCALDFCRTVGVPKNGK
jgi:hypothetical protein